MISMCTLLSVHAQLPDIPDSIFFPEVIFHADEPDWTYKIEDGSKLELVPTQSTKFSISSATGIWEMESIEENGILYSLYNSFKAFENWGGLLSAIDIATGEEVLYKSYNPDILDPPISPTNMTITSNGNIHPP